MFVAVCRYYNKLFSRATAVQSLVHAILRYSLYCACSKLIIMLVASLTVASLTAHIVLLYLAFFGAHFRRCSWSCWLDCEHAS
jgi:hypothetical protein